MECRDYGVYFEDIYLDRDGNEKKRQFIGAIKEVSNELNKLQIDFNTIEI